MAHPRARRSCQHVASGRRQARHTSTNTAVAPSAPRTRVSWLLDSPSEARRSARVTSAVAASGWPRSPVASWPVPDLTHCRLQEQVSKPLRVCLPPREPRLTDMIQPGLDRIAQLVKDLRFPWKAVHVAGTNGKGSVCAHTVGLLRRRNIRVGKFTSPYLIDRYVSR